MSTALVPLIPTLGAFIPALFRRSGRDVCVAAAAAVTLTSLALLLMQAPLVIAGETVRYHVSWIPQFNLSFSFFVDGLGLFFATLILGMGLLIILYARYYLSSADPIGRFYTYLLLFQGAMLGIVLSDNVILMLVFWELTSLSSFLLIGYWSHQPASRQGARMALVVTGGGGLVLIAGMLILGGIAGTYELSEIIQRGEQVRSSPLCGPALALILIGAFTKSAQFPFHFWLPHAMAAPTPVSAYLHSATMVKAGIFLLARLWPVFAATDMWFLTVSLTGLVTMVIAAWIALFKDDLKLLLAFSTVSHLGLITMLLGLGSPLAAVAAMFHILNHAAFKAALFMSAGIVDHEAGTRDVRKLGGLATVMPLTATLTLIAAAAMAGVPLLNGFVSKEMMLEQASVTVYAGLPWLFPALATSGALLSVAYSARLAAAICLGPLKHQASHPPHDPPFGMSLPVLVLVVPVVVIGVLPGLAQPLVELTAASVVGGPPPPFHLSIWHGVTPAVLMSMSALAGGLALFALYRPINAARSSLPRPDAKQLFEDGIRAAVALAQSFTDRLQSNDLQRYVLVIVIAAIGIGVFGFWNGTHAPGAQAPLAVNVPAAIAWVALLGACVLAVMRHHDRLLLLIVTAVAGFVVALAFLQFSSPDLALTQISVEVVTTILLLLALNLLPKTTPRETGTGRRFIDGAVAVGAGAAAASLALAVMTRGFESISGYHLAESKPGGGGTNVVNVILVDFRAYDTFGEIIVLGIAGIAILAMLDSARRGASGLRLATLVHPAEVGQAHPLILTVATRVLLPLAITVGLYIFLRGHNLPGGGFIAGIVIAISFIMQYMASGYAWAHQRARFNPQAMIGAGVALAGLSGMASWVFGYPLLTSTHRYFDVPLLGQIELASVAVFDLGVCLTVVGTVLLVLATISRVEGPVNGSNGSQPEQAPATAEPKREPARTVQSQREEVH